MFEFIFTFMGLADATENARRARRPRAARPGLDALEGRAVPSTAFVGMEAIAPMAASQPIAVSSPEPMQSSGAPVFITPTNEDGMGGPSYELVDEAWPIMLEEPEAMLG